jgi:hypothetical protein
MEKLEISDTWADTVDETSEVKDKKVCFNAVETAANKLLLTVATESTLKFGAISSTLFVLGYLVVSGGIFGGLLYYFYYSGCVLNSTVVSNSENLDFYDVYNTNRNYLCNARLPWCNDHTISFHSSFSPLYPPPGAINQIQELPDIYCQLGNIPCHELGSFRSDLCSSTQCAIKSANSTASFGFNCAQAVNYTFAGRYRTHGGFRNELRDTFGDEFKAANQNVFLEYSNVVSIEYVSCEPTSTVVLNAFQYTMAAQLVFALIFCIFYKLSKKMEWSALWSSDTYLNPFESKVHHRKAPEAASIKNNNEADDDDSQKHQTDDSTVPKSIDDNTAFTDRTAMFLLRSAAPKSTYNLSGVSAGAFIMWYVPALGFVFGILLWYFLAGSCSVQSVIIPRNLRSDDYLSTYASNGNYICSTKATTYTAAPFQQLPVDINFKFDVDCLLDGLSCSDYGGVGTSSCKVSCDQCMQRPWCLEC